MALFGGKTQPSDRLYIVLGHSPAFSVHDPEFVLSKTNALLGERQMTTHPFHVRRNSNKGYVLCIQEIKYLFN